MIENILLTWLGSALLSYILTLIGAIQCGKKYGWQTPVTKEDAKMQFKLTLYALIPAYGIIRAAQFALNPFKYMKG